MFHIETHVARTGAGAAAAAGNAVAAPGKDVNEARQSEAKQFAWRIINDVKSFVVYAKVFSTPVLTRLLYADW